MKNGKRVSVTEFKRLLHYIKDRRPDVGVRVRLAGKMWSDFFYTLESVADDAALFHNLYNGLVLRVSNLNDVVQFELECSFFGFHAHYHYDVLPVSAEVNLPG